MRAILCFLLLGIFISSAQANISTDHNPPVISSVTPVNACIGSTITIIGSNLTGITSVSIGSVQVNFINELSSTHLEVSFNTVTSGTLSVNTVNGTTSSTQTISVSAQVTPTLSISASANSIFTGTPVTFTAMATNQGTSPVYQWFKNNNPVGTNSATYTDAGLLHLDIVYCQLTSSEICASPVIANSNIINMTVVSPANAGTIVGSNSLCIGSNTTLSNPSASSTFFAPGMLYGGGVIAYILQPGDPGYLASVQQGFIASSSDLSSAVPWYNGSMISTGALSPSLGDGLNNSTQIVNQQGVGTYAASICSNLNLNGYSDWHLPSFDELQKLYDQKAMIGGFGILPYWSSTESSSSNARAIQFSNGVSLTSLKSNLFSVRPIRYLNTDTHWESSDPSVASIDPITGEVNALTAGTTTITYTVYNAYGNASTNMVLTVHSNASIGFVSGGPGAFVCPQLSFTYSVTGVVTGNGTGAWSSSNPLVASVDQTGLATTLGGGQTQITYSISNGCGGTVSASQTLRVKPYAYLSGVSGPFTLCPGQTSTYTADNLVLGDGSGSWSTSNGSVATVDAFGQVTAWSAGNVDITYTISGNSCSGAPLSGSISVVVQPSANAGNITGSASVCLGGQQSLTTDGDPGGIWQSSNPSVATVSSTGVVNSLASGSTQISYTVNNGCNAPQTSTIAFTVIGSLNPPVVEGLKNVCGYIGNGNAVTYTATAPGAIGFNWVIPQNVTILSGQGTAQVTLSFAAGFAAQANKQIKVSATYPCGSSMATIYYLASQLPGTPASITPLFNDVCQAIGSGGFLAYSIPRVPGATSYVWTAQSGTTTLISINGPGENDTLMVVLLSSGFSTSPITVQAVNACGISNARSLTITRSSPATPGLITGPTNICAHLAPSGTPATYSVSPQASVTEYIWSIPSGATGITYSGSSHNQVSFIFPAGYNGGTIEVTATNGCGSSTNPRSLSLTRLNPGTPSPIDVINTVSCSDPSSERVYTYSLSSMPSNASGIAWTIPPAGTILSGQGTTSITVSYPSLAVSGTVTATAFNLCANSVTRSIEVKLAACPPDVPGKMHVVSESLFVKSTDNLPISVSMYPNPSSTNTLLKINSRSVESVQIRIIDLSGHVIEEWEKKGAQQIIMGQKLTPGVYFVEIRQGTYRHVEKLIRL